MFFGHFLSNNTQVVIEPSREFEGQYKLQRDQAPAKLQNMSLNIHYTYIFEYISLYRYKRNVIGSLDCTVAVAHTSNLWMMLTFQQ